MSVKIKTYPEKVLVAIHDKFARTAKRFGAFVRRSAMSSIKKAKVKRKSELTPAAEGRYQDKLRRYKAGDLKNKPIRGYKPSNPGEPPRWRPGSLGQKSALRSLIVFDYNDSDKSVVVGPREFRTKRGTTGIGALERGGTAKSAPGWRPIRMRARPFMVPAMNKNLHILRNLKG